MSSPQQRKFFHSGALDKLGIKEPKAPKAPPMPAPAPKAPKIPGVQDNDDLPATGKYFQNLVKKLRMK